MGSETSSPSISASLMHRIVDPADDIFVVVGTQCWTVHSAGVVEIGRES